ncbi:MAG TPA: type II CAAX endopeptidase family protein [Opitutus sp.]|nr:type II CAAX endopeptidase family protein [Opitutus sp.]
MSELAVRLPVVVLELALLLAGLVLLWRLALSERARTGPVPANLPAWDLPVPDFFLVLFVFIAGILALSFLTGLAIRPFHLSTDTQAILLSAGFQLGLLVAPAAVPLKLGHFPLAPPLSRRTFRDGAATFLVSLPVVTAVSLVWIPLLRFCGVPVEPQDALQLFLNAKLSPILFVLITLAVLVAPIGEELFFRATLYRYLRTRFPRWAALLLPAIVFSFFHQNVAAFAPLVALAIIFSLAYERTGNIGTSMVAHGLFNLHTIILILAGVTS